MKTILYSLGNTYSTEQEINAAIFIATLAATNTVMWLSYNIKQAQRKKLFIMLGFSIYTTHLTLIKLTIKLHFLSFTVTFQRLLVFFVGSHLVSVFIAAVWH